jgi:transcriptional regulator with XRE-family HTH domain
MLRIDECNHEALTMQSLAKKIGYTREYLQAIKSGKKGQTLENLQRIAAALQCTPAELLPISWQKPSLEPGKIQSTITHIIEVYDALKKQHKKVTPAHVAAVIAAMSQMPPNTRLTDEEIIRYFQLLALK